MALSRLLPPWLRSVPVDLWAVLTLTVLVNVVVTTPVVRETPLRTVIGLVFVLLVPGYAFVAAVFPGDGDSPVRDDDEFGDPSAGLEPTDRRGIDGIERAILAAVCSVCLVPLVGLAIHFSPWLITEATYLGSLTALVVVLTVIAAITRYRLRPTDRYRVPYRRWLAAARPILFSRRSRLDTVLTVAMVASIVVATGAVGAAMLTSEPGERFSAVYVGTEDADGEFVAANYPAELTTEETADLILGVENHEHRPVEYTVVTAEQAIDREGPTDVTVAEQRELERADPTLEHGDRWERPQTLSPTFTGEVRLVWLLYTDEVPAEPTLANADDHVHLWVDVSEPLV